MLPHPSAVQSVAFARDGRVATAAEDGIIRIWAARGRGRPMSFRAERQAVFSVRFSADGRRLLTAGEDGVVRLWDAAGGPPLGELKGLAAGRCRPTSCPVVPPSLAPGRTAPPPLAAGGDIDAARPSQRGELSRDGDSVVSGGADGTVRVWNVASGSLRRLRGQNAPNTANIAPDGTQVIGASFDGTVRIWNLERGGSRLIQAPRFRKNAAAFDASGDRIVFAGTDPDKRIFVARTDGDDRLVLRGHRGNVLDVAFSPDGNHILSASEDGTARIWSAATGTLERTLRGHSEAVDSAAYSEDGSRVVTAGADGTVRVWNLDDGRSVIMRGHEGPVYSAEFDRGGDRVVTAGQDGTVRVWDASGGETLVLL